MTERTKNVLAIDASLLTVGAVAILDGRLAEAATFTHNTRRLRGLAKYAAIAAAQATDVRALLDRYARDIPVIVEAPANADGTVWQTRSTFTVALGVGTVVGVAHALGFEHVELVAAGARGGWGGKKNAWLAKGLPGVEPKTSHERDAAAMGVWWLAKRREPK